MLQVLSSLMFERGGPQKEVEKLMGLDAYREE